MALSGGNVRVRKPISDGRASHGALDVEDAGSIPAGSTTIRANSTVGLSYCCCLSTMRAPHVDRQHGSYYFNFEESIHSSIRISRRPLESL